MATQISYICAVMINRYWTNSAHQLESVGIILKFKKNTINLRIAYLNLMLKVMLLKPVSIISGWKLIAEEGYFR